MAELVSYLCIVAVFFVNGVSSNFFWDGFDTPKHSIDVCSLVCVRKVAVESPTPTNIDSCSRGCRFFVIAKLINKCNMLDEGATRDACKSSCVASYGKNNLDLSSCFGGCMIPSVPKIIPVPISAFSWTLMQDNGDSLQPIDSFLEQDDALTDPSLRSQVSKTDSMHIPEMRVRTLPVSQFKDEGVGGWWGGCGRGLPHCLAASLLLLLILLALWFGLSLEEIPKGAELPPPHHDFSQAPPLPEKIPLA